MTTTEFFIARFEPDVVTHQRPSVRNRTRSLFKCHLAPELGTKSLDKVDYSDVQNRLNALLAAGYAVPTAVKAREVLAGILTHAQRVGALPRGPLPTEGTHLPYYETPEKKPLTWKQVISLAKEMEPGCPTGAILVRFLAR